MLYQRRVSVGMSKITVVFCLLLFDFRRVVKNVGCSVLSNSAADPQRQRKGVFDKERELTHSWPSFVLDTTPVADIRGNANVNNGIINLVISFWIKAANNEETGSMVKPLA
jgi:hypothetical protein